MRPLACACCAILMALPGNINAQVQSILQPGQRVRVTHHCGTVVECRTDIGAVLGLRADTLMMRRGGLPMAIPLDTFRRLEVSRGKRNHLVRGGAIGLLAGVLLGGLIGGLDGDCTHEWGSLCAAAGAMVVGSVGLVIGLGAGASMTSERWEPVPMRR